jgi:hypothetical protein
MRQNFDNIGVWGFRALQAANISSCTEQRHAENKLICQKQVYRARRGNLMITREIVITCSNPHVARAAVASIGGDFARQFSREAALRELSSGMLASRLVSDFARLARDSDWDEVADAVRGADTPILTGLRHILERALDAENDEDGYSSPSSERPDSESTGGWRTRNAFAFCSEVGQCFA